MVLLSLYLACCFYFFLEIHSTHPLYFIYTICSGSIKTTFNSPLHYIWLSMSLFVIYTARYEINVYTAQIQIIWQSTEVLHTRMAKAVYKLPQTLHEEFSFPKLTLYNYLILVNPMTVNRYCLFKHFNFSNYLWLFLISFILNLILWLFLII